MNLLDAVIIALALLAAISGFQRGAALQILAYAGLIAGLIVGALLAPSVAGLAEEPFTQAIVALATLLVVAAIGDALGWLIGRRVWAVAQRSRVAIADSVGGSFVAIGAVLVATWFIAFNLVQGPFPALSRQIRQSAVVGAIDAVLPRPPSILNQIRGFLDRFGFPEVFAGIPPAPAGPVEGPTRGEVGRAIRAADQSTLRIIGEACGRLQEGSGFLVSETYLVTNAHVVAGVDAPQVQQQDGGSFPGTTVLFDPDLDVAVISIGTSPAGPLDLVPAELSRGATGAVLGYPGGGPLVGGPGAVRRAILAVGRDIYGEGTVRRRVYELQAEVQPGNSGGPFVTEEGDVAGVVFAASTTNDNVGYALTSEEVMPRVNEGVGSTQPVDTGPCIR